MFRCFSACIANSDAHFLDLFYPMKNAPFIICIHIFAVIVLKFLMFWIFCYLLTTNFLFRLVKENNDLLAKIEDMESKEGNLNRSKKAMQTQIEELNVNIETLNNVS